MKILLLCTHLNIGGISSYLLSLADGFVRKGHQVYLGASGGDLAEKFIGHGVELINLPIKTKSELSPKIFFSFLKLSLCLRGKDIKIIHANTRVSALLAAMLSRNLRIPYLVTCHGFFRPHLWRKTLPLWGKRVIAISEQVKEHLVNDFHLAPERVRLIYNGIASEKLKEGSFRYSEAGEAISREIKKSLGLNNGPVVGIIARLSEVKGHRYLIQAMQEIIRDLPQVQLLIVGDGREKNHLIQQVRDAGVEKNIIFKTSVENTETVLAAMDLYVSPSLQEGLGLSLMEAMAQGLAVVATDVGGIPNLIQDGFNGSLVKVRDGHALACAIKRLLQDDQQVKLYGMNARQTIAANFSLEKMVADTETVYRECLGENY